MKKFFLSALVALMTIPVMAQEPVQANPDVDAQEEYTTGESDVDLADENEFYVEDVEAQARSFTCVARNRFGFRFRGEGRNLRRARMSALRSCQSRSPFGGCYIQTCRVRF